MSFKIPNLNTFSTIIDRLCIENVKLAYFLNSLKYESLSKQKQNSIKVKIYNQKLIIKGIKKEIKIFFLEIFKKKKYLYIKEERTFE
jgi:hypothetical protein